MLRTDEEVALARDGLLSPKVKLSLPSFLMPKKKDVQTGATKYSVFLWWFGVLGW